MGQRPELILTSVIRGSDAIGLAMNFYLMKRLIFGYVQGIEEIDYLLKTRIIRYFLIFKEKVVNLFLG
jgi:hypothetical protein